MELWIRSKDKMKLTRFIDIGIFEEQEGYTIYYDDSIDNMLGTYATKERALEVLDEIQHFRNHLNILELKPRAYYSENNYDTVYEMPKE